MKSASLSAPQVNVSSGAKNRLLDGQAHRGYPASNAGAADLATHGLGGVRFKQIFFDGRRQISARYPNFDPGNPITGGWAYVDREKPPADLVAAVGAKRVLRCRPADARRWANPMQGCVFIFPSHEWWNNIVPIASADPANRVITLQRNCSCEIKPDDRYYVMGLPEELDAPGEWCVDAAGEALYFWPPSPMGDKPVYVPTTRTIPELNGARHVTVQGLKAWTGTPSPPIRSSWILPTTTTVCGPNRRRSS